MKRSARGALHQLPPACPGAPGPPSWVQGSGPPHGRGRGAAGRARSPRHAYVESRGRPCHLLFIGRTARRLGRASSGLRRQKKPGQAPNLLRPRQPHGPGGHTSQHRRQRQAHTCRAGLRRRARLGRERSGRAAARSEGNGMGPIQNGLGTGLLRAALESHLCAASALAASACGLGQRPTHGQTAARLAGMTESGGGVR